MSYLDVISLAEAKNHLRVDESFTEDDASIERMIKSALQLVENNTNHIMYQRDKTYFRTVDEKRIVVYDYPINDYDTDVTALHYSLRHEYVADKITLDVGYKTKEDIPSALIDLALSLIAGMYYDYETDEIRAKAEEVQRITMFNYKRCIVS